MIELLLGINRTRGTTLVVVTHDPEIASMADARILLRDGRVALMRFVLLTALRETRSAWKRLVFFFVCIAIGVGAIVALRSVIQSVRQVLSAEARTLIAADILMSTDRPWQAGTHDRIAARVAAIPGAQRIDSTEMATMARPADEAGAVERGCQGRRAARGAAGVSVLRTADAAGRPPVLPRSA